MFVDFVREVIINAEGNGMVLVQMNLWESVWSQVGARQSCAGPVPPTSTHPLFHTRRNRSSGYVRAYPNCGLTDDLRRSHSHTSCLANTVKRPLDSSSWAAKKEWIDQSPASWFLPCRSWIKYRWGDFLFATPQVYLLTEKLHKYDGKLGVDHTLCMGRDT